MCMGSFSAREHVRPATAMWAAAVCQPELAQVR